MVIGVVGVDVVYVVMDDDCIKVVFEVFGVDVIMIFEICENGIVCCVDVLVKVGFEVDLIVNL